MTDTLQQALDTPGCERLRDFAAVGPAQRAALELFVDRVRAADQQAEPVAWAISYDGLRPYSLWDSGNGPLLDLEVKRLGGAAKKMPLHTYPPKAAPMTEDEIRELSAKHIKSGMFKGAPATWGVVDFAREIEAKYGVKHV